MRASPPVTRLPDSAISPAGLATAFDSPVSIDSSSSSSPSTTMPSTGTWSPGPSSNTSSMTSESGFMSRGEPLRHTRTRGVVSTVRRSSTSLARSSCITPMAVLATSTTPKSMSCQGPMTTMTTSSVPRMALKRVRTLARTMSAALRPLPLGARLTWPASTRWRTAASERPPDPVGFSPACAPRPATRSTATASLAAFDPSGATRDGPPQSPRKATLHPP